MPGITRQLFHCNVEHCTTAHIHIPIENTIHPIVFHAILFNSLSFLILQTYHSYQHIVLTESIFDNAHSNSTCEWMRLLNYMMRRIHFKVITCNIPFHTHSISYSLFNNNIYYISQCNSDSSWWLSVTSCCSTYIVFLIDSTTSYFCHHIYPVLSGDICDDV